MVFWKDKENWSREKTFTSSKWSRSIFDKRQWKQKKWFLPQCQRRRHGEALQNKTTGWGWILYCKKDHLQDSPGLGGPLQQRRGRSLRQSPQTLCPGGEANNSRLVSQHQRSVGDWEKQLEVCQEAWSWTVWGSLGRIVEQHNTRGHKNPQNRHNGS